MQFYIFTLLVFTCVKVGDCVIVQDSWTIAATEVRNEHNAKRRLHKDTPDLSADFKLTKDAVNCAKVMLTYDMDASRHPCNAKNVGQGENIYEARSSLMSDPVKSLGPAMSQWYAEYNLMDNLRDPEWAFTIDNNKVGHVTQLLWKSTTKVGCGGAYGERNGIRLTYIVCRYSPQGNDYRVGSLEDNVLPLINGAVSCEDNPATKGLCNTVTNVAASCNGPFAGMFKENCKATCRYC